MHIHNMLPQIKKGLAVILAGCLFSSVSAHATEQEWQFHLAAYGWLAGQNGTLATFPNLPPVDIDVDFWDDVFGNVNGAVFLAGEAHKEKWGIFLDTAYVNVESDTTTPGTRFSSVTSKSESWMVSGTGGYRFFENEDGSLTLTGGVRYWSVESTLEFGAGDLPAQESSNRENWLDPLIGLKGRTNIRDSKFSVSGALTIGGFGAGSDIMWDVNANIGYQWTSRFTTLIGYRFLDVDYEEDGFIYDISQYGPVLGLSWRF